jgi:hypothetical protein
VAGDGAKARPRRRARPARKTTRLARDFYASALDAAEQRELAEAAEVEGLDHEIAVLRVKLREAIKQEPADMALMLRGIELLVKAVSARYRLSKEESDDLADNLGAVIEGVGGLLMPEAFRE